MTGRGGIFLIVALILFAAFFANVSMGAADMKPVLNDVREALTLFAAAIFFVVGVLVREARQNGNGQE
ncbi:MAG: hypothetical protein AAGK00_11775 [Pseudomonadota bacterium]